MRGVKQLAVTVVLVAAVAAAAVAANLALLRSTQDSSDPVGRLSPRAVFSTPGAPSSSPGDGQTPATDDNGSDSKHADEPDD